MRLNKNEMIELSKYKNSLYEELKVEFLYHSNRMEGSTFSIENLYELIEHGNVEGRHKIDDVYETANSVILFDRIIDDLGKPISKELLFDYHKLLKSGTSDEREGLSGCYKKMMNRIRNSSIITAYPLEVEGAVNELINNTNKKIKSIEDIARFHSRFEHIHPFQDGNGRIGRFLVLKQCLENNIDLIAIDESFSEAYKAALEFSQTTGDPKLLVDIFKDCQEYLDKKLEIYKPTVDLLHKSTTIRNKSLSDRVREARKTGENSRLNNSVLMNSKKRGQER